MSNQPLLPENEQDLVSRIFHLTGGYADARSLWLVAKLGVADLLASGAQSVGELAAKAQVQEMPLYRVLRAVAALGVLTETRPHCFALTPLGQLLRSDVPSSMRAWVIMTGGPIFNSFANALYSLQTGKPAFEQVFGCRLYDYLKAHPEDAAAFNAAMVTYGGQATAGLLEKYDFANFKTVVDVGAGPGTVLMGVLNNYPNINGVLFDLPHIVELSRDSVATAGLSDRCQVVGGNFFESVPAGGDLYLLSSILHNWSDAEAIAILKNCRRSINKHGRLLLLEIVIPPGDQPHFGKPTDVTMLVAIGGRERSESEFSELLEHSGFKLSRVIPTSYLMSVVEALPY